MAGINEKTLAQLTYDDIEVWVAENEERALWYVEVTSKTAPKKVYAKKKVQVEGIDSKTGEKVMKEKEVADKENYHYEDAPLTLMAIKNELARRFPELGYPVKGEAKKKTTETRAEKAAAILAKFKK